MRIEVYASNAEHDRADASFRAAVSVADRVTEVWRLSEELWRMRGD